MYAIRAMMLTAAFLISPMGASQSCAYPGGEPDGGVDGEACPPSSPQAGCACLVEEEMGCTDDGLVHEEAFLCQEGVWVDVYELAAADAVFCDHPDLVYNYCAWIEGEVWSNCTVGE